MARAHVAPSVAFVLLAACGAATSPQMLAAGNGVSITIAPTSAEVPAGTEMSFQATVTGSGDLGVQWTLEEGDTAGSVAADGTYTAPATTGGPYHLQARSNADRNKVATAVITVTPPPALSILPASPNVNVGQVVTFTVNVSLAVQWSVDEASGCGAIDRSTGVYTAPGSPGICHVTATEQTDASKVAHATVKVFSKTQGSWVDISPPAARPIDTGSNFHYGLAPMDADQNGTVFVGDDASSSAANGLWKSTNYGTTWARVDGSLAGADATNVNSLDVVSVRISPASSNVVFLGTIKSGSGGFCKSTDGGQTWVQKLPGDWEHDLYWMDIDPHDPNHLLITFHSPGKPPGDGTNAGIGESFDGGETWTGHPGQAWGAGQHIHFLGRKNDGSADSSGTFWIVATQYNGIWRTENAGSSWTQVATWNMTHGQNQMYRSVVTGALYLGSVGEVYRSLDNGRTWSATGAQSTGDGYGGIVGDGVNIWTMLANTGAAAFGPYQWQSLPETDQTSAPGASHWSVYGAETYIDGPYEMHFDSAHRILYSAQWGAGLWKLQLPAAP
jgi:hypothetical protein